MQWMLDHRNSFISPRQLRHKRFGFCLLTEGLYLNETFVCTYLFSSIMTKAHVLFISCFYPFSETNLF